MKHVRFAALAKTVIFMVASCAASASKPPQNPHKAANPKRTLQNPVVAGFHPDPSVCRVGEDYFLANSSFSYSPGIPLFHSRDLVHWRPIGYAVDGAEDLPLAGGGLSAGLWAPTLRHHNGLFYLVTTNKTKGGNFFVSARDPAGPWSSPVWFDPDGWDPSLFFDEDGKVYLSRNGEIQEHGKRVFGIVQYQFDLDTGKPLGPTKLIWRGSGGFGAEGPHMYKVDGWYYLMVAEGGTHAGHMVTIARARSPWGPFEGHPQNPILSHRNHLLARIQATGHGDLVQAHDGSWWMLFLGIRNFASPTHMMHVLGRETFLAPVSWAEGWPVVNGGQPIDEEMMVPLLPAHAWPATHVRDNFDAASLDLQWNFLRNPKPGSWSLAEPPGSLTLRGHEQSLSEAESPAFVGRRLEHTHNRAATELDFQPGADSDEAGLTVYMDEAHHYDLAVTLRNGRRVVVVRRSVYDFIAEVLVQPLPPGSVVLEVEANPWAYVFYLGTGTSRSKLTKLRSKLLSTEVAGGFTGMYYGLYASSKAGRDAPLARFAWFDYEPQEAK